MSSYARNLNSGLNLTSKLAVVAGGSQGIGRGIAIRLARAGSSVLVIGRSEARLKEVVDHCRQNVPFGTTTAHFDYISADLSVVSGMKAAIEAIKSKSKGSVDYLFETQGGPPMGNYNLTSDGIEQHFATQVLSRFALNEALASQGILKTASVNIAAPGAKATEYNLDDVESRSSKNSNAISSMLAKAKNEGVVTDAATLHLQSKYPNIRFYHVFPGAVTTQAAANQGFPFPLPQLYALFGPIIERTIGNSPESYAEIPVMLAANESEQKVREVDGQQGCFLDNNVKKVEISEWAKKAENQEKAYEKLKSYLN